MDSRAAEALRAAGSEPTPLHNNCSGKHAGMLLAAKLLGLSTGDYTAPDHPLQRQNLERLARSCGLDAGAVGLATDGCSVPTYHLPLAAAAHAYAALADPRGAGLEGAELAAARRVVEAMASAPEMVAGPGRFTTRLIEVTGGRVIGKEGAEGFYAVAVRGPTALGIAFKVADGSERCRDGVVLDLLRLTGSLSGEELDRLSGYHHPERRNHNGLSVGRIEPDVELLES
jgi:L-asparaginase II